MCRELRMGTASNQETSNQIHKTDGDNKYKYKYYIHIDTACVLVLVVNIQTLYVKVGIEKASIQDVFSSPVLIHGLQALRGPWQCEKEAPRSYCVTFLASGVITTFHALGPFETWEPPRIWGMLQTVYEHVAIPYLTPELQLKGFKIIRDKVFTDRYFAVAGTPWSKKQALMLCL